MNRSGKWWTALCVALVPMSLSAGTPRFEGAFAPVDRYDGMPPHELDLTNKNTVIFGDVVDLSGRTLQSNSSLLVVEKLGVVAREIRIGPDSRIRLNGSYVPGNSPTSAGSLYLVAPKIILDGANEAGALGHLLELSRDGGMHPTEPIFNGARGRVIVCTDKVVLSERYIAAKVKAMTPVGAAADQYVPSATLRVIARGFSPRSTIHAFTQRENMVKWSGLGAAYGGWVEGEPPASFLKRELRLSYDTSETPFAGPDEVRPFSEAAQVVDGAILSRWYTTLAVRESGVIQSAMARQDYAAAGQAITALKPLLTTAPHDTLTSSAYSAALNTITASEDQLRRRRTVQRIEIARADAAPVTVTTIRDLVPSDIRVLPTSIPLRPIVRGEAFRVGFLDQPTGSSVVRLSLYGRLAVDAATLAAVSETEGRSSPGATVSAGSDDIDYGTLTMSIDGVQSQTAHVDAGGLVSIDLSVPENRLVQVFARLAQPQGVPVTVDWSWKQPADRPAPQPLIVALSLRIADLELRARGGRLQNTFNHPVEIDYVVDTAVRRTGFPLRLASGATSEKACDENCFAPATAVRHDLDLTEPVQAFEPISGQSALRVIEIENTIGADPQMGPFHSLTLTFRYKPTPSASEQIVGPITLDARSKAGARQVLRFVGPANGGGAVSAVGRVEWGARAPFSYRDLRADDIEHTTVRIDESWFAN